MGEALPGAVRMIGMGARAQTSSAPTNSFGQLSLLTTIHQPFIPLDFICKAGFIPLGLTTGSFIVSFKKMVTVAVTMTGSGKYRAEWGSNNVLYSSSQPIHMAYHGTWELKLTPAPSTGYTLSSVKVDGQTVGSMFCACCPLCQV